jgi:hypothetical protein
MQPFLLGTAASCTDTVRQIAEAVAMRVCRCFVFLLFAAAVVLSNAQNSLPGKGLAQHPFLYCGEWNFIEPQQTIYLVRHGKVVWTYSIPFDVVVYGEHHKAELGDCTRLSNGNILFSRRFGATEVTPKKKIVWNYDAPPNTEIHSVQPIGKDRVLLMQNGIPAKLLLIDIKTGKTEKELELPTGSNSIHGQFRRVRMTTAGTFLAAQMGMNMVVEYDAAGKPIWSVDAESAWSAVRLKNGNTLIGGDKAGYVREVNPHGQTVWEITKDELPGIRFANVQEVSRLANGDTIICNWIAGDNNTADWSGTAQVVEVTPEKKVVWVLSQWRTPNLGPASSIQLLDEPGTPENGDLQR